MQQDNLQIRLATRDDAPAILEMLKTFADFVNAQKPITTTAAHIAKTLFDDHATEVMIADVNGEPVGYMQFCPHVSGFKLNSGVYLEILYVAQSVRGKGVGKRMMQHLAKTVLERGGDHIEWCSLNWNDGAINFYDNIEKADKLDFLVVYEMEGDKLKAFAEEAQHDETTE